MCCNSQSGRYEFHLQTGSIKLNTQQRHCSLYAVLFNCQTNCKWVKFIVFQKQSHAKRLETWYLYSYSAHLLNTYLKWLLKRKKQVKESIWLKREREKEKRKKKKKKLFKSWPQLISITSSASYRVSCPLLRESAKWRKWEKWEEEEVWRRVLGQKSLGDYSPLSHV